MIPIAKPLLGEEEKKAVLEVLNSGMLAQGQKVVQFEQEFARFIDVKHAIATSNGTTALHTALLAHGIGKGDEVITAPFSFVATANAIRMCGAYPVFIDIDENTFNLNPGLIEPAITKKTKAILPVHLFGQSCDMDKINAIAQKHNLIVIEDACQAHGAQWNRKKVGSFGTGCFSFYPTKNMTTGEGGIITTNDDNIAQKARLIREHGSQKRYYHQIVGFNHRMTDIAAAIGIEQLRKLHLFNSLRQHNAHLLSKMLRALPGVCTPIPHAEHVFHQFSIRITKDFPKSRDEVLTHLSSKGIGSAVFYPLPIHKQESYKEWNHFSFPIAERVAQEILALPIHPSITSSDLESIAAALQELYQA